MAKKSARAHRKKRKYLTARQHSAILAEYESRVPIADISSKYDVDLSYPGKLARKAKLKMRETLLSRERMARAAKRRSKRRRGKARS